MNLRNLLPVLLLPALLLVLVACSGSQPAAISTAEAKMEATVQAVPTPTQMPPTSTPAPTATENVTLNKLNGVSSSEDLPSELTAICQLDSEQLKVSCQANRTSRDSVLNWREDNSGKTFSGEDFDFSLYDPIKSVISVTLKECIDASCNKVESVIDVSHLVSVTMALEDTTSRDPVEKDSSSEIMTMQSEYSQGRCEPDGMTYLESPPMNPTKVIYIDRMGGMHGDHITPIDHIYINYNPNESHDVYAMADGHLVYVGHTGVDHRVIIEYSCSLYSIYIHIQELDQAIDSQLEWVYPQGNSKGRSYPRISVKKGTVIGQVSGRGSFDVSIVATRVTLPGFVNLESYQGEFWKYHCVDPYDYWHGPFRQELLDKTIIANEDSPGGKIDYDVDGKLVGNWFEENSGGYSGARTSNDPNGSKGHLAFAYNSRIKNTVWISFGTFGDTFVNASKSSRGYGVKDNVPDPVDIGVESRLIKFELIALDKGNGELTGYKVASTGKLWNGETYPDGGRLAPVYRADSVGTLLVAMLDDRTIKVEVFHKTTLDKVTGFTDKFKIYER